MTTKSRNIEHLESSIAEKQTEFELLSNGFKILIRARLISPDCEMRCRLRLNTNYIDEQTEGLFSLLIKQKAEK